jgi:hypothetical protein
MKATDPPGGPGSRAGFARSPYPLTGRWAVRAVVHLRFLNGEGAWDVDPRLSAGAVYRFGR